MVAIESFTGAIIAPSNSGYDDARKLWNGMLDRRPAVIARPRSSAEVAAAVGYARQNGFKIAVKGGGHSVPGYSMCDGGFVIDLSDMRAVAVEPTKGIAKAAG